MASAMAMMAAFSSEHELSLQFHASSVLAGTLAGLLAAEIKADAGAAFLAGLLSEVGAMACVAIDGERFTQIYREAGTSWDMRAELEQKRYGAPSWQVGMRLLARNQLPEHICAAVGAHHGDADAETHSLLARVTVFGRMAALEIVQLREGQPLAEVVPRIVELAALSGLPDSTPERIEALIQRAIASAESKIASAR
jgi:HD-like signal output (HDOD) protein